MTPFDLLGPLPTGTTVLEASAGTGKTYTVGALVARYVAEGRATLDEMLVITFGRVASQELRERVREQLVESERALADPEHARTMGGVIAHLAGDTDEVVAERRKRIADALAGFDGATIATTHQFCQLVLKSLGVAGDSDSDVELVESLDDLVVEVVDDLYLGQFGDDTDVPPFNRSTALELGRAAVGDPQATLAPAGSANATVAARVSFARAVRTEMELRKQRLGVLSYDDLLSRLRDALSEDDAPARERMRQRWSVVLVDEFQDTDPVQWAVLDQAFTGHATLVLIGDPKQAIYAFRGGDIVTYLDAARTAGTRQTLATNFRSDGPLVDALQVLTRNAQLGDEGITVHEVSAHHQGSRLDGPTSAHPVRLRSVPNAGEKSTIPIGDLRPLIAADLADDVARLLSSGSTFDDGQGARPVRAGDVAILIFSLKHVDLFRAELRARGIPSVLTSGASVLLSSAGDEWLSLLEALEKQRTSRVRAVALSSFVGLSPAELDAGGDELTDTIAERVRGWLDLFRARGIAAVHEAIRSDGLAERVLSRPDGERRLTDLNHLGQVLHDAAHRERLGLPALLEWLRKERRRAATSAGSSTERARRLDSDAAAVQIVTIHGSKGLQYPVVYLPLLFDRWKPDEKMLLLHDGSERMLDVGGSPQDEVKAKADAEDAAEQLRLTYVALTRAQSQVVCWWAPSWFAGHSGLTRMLLGRRPGEAIVPDQVAQGPSASFVMEALEGWQAAGALHVETVQLDSASVMPESPDVAAIGVRTFDRALDSSWRRTSYSGLIRAEEQVAVAVTVEPEVSGTVDEDEPVDDIVPEAPRPDDRTDALLSPMNDLPAGATFGSLVHGVLEHADPSAADLLDELRTKVAEQLRWWPVEATVEAIASSLVPMQHTSLGPLADGRTLLDIPGPDRLRELDFEFPLVGGDRLDDVLHHTALREVADVLRRHLPEDDPMRAYADRLESPSLGDQQLRGYLSGSIDVVLRVPDESVGHRYLVVDYKTNKLGGPDQPLTALDYTPDLMADAMLHSHYPLQALLYSVVLHRYLRWRQPGYDPDEHLGGILYLYVRGMCGPETPEIDGEPCGVFAWRPPAAMIVELSELLAGQEVPA